MGQLVDEIIVLIALGSSHPTGREHNRPEDI